MILTENLFKIASKLTSIETILANIVLAGYHIFHIFGSILVSITTILKSIVTILASIEQVNTPLKSIKIDFT